jgi:hypothetical protein
MQQKYTPNKSLRNKIVTGAVVGLAALVGLINDGCLPNSEERLKNYNSIAKTNSGKLELCGCIYLSEQVKDWNVFDGWVTYNYYREEKNPVNLAFRDEKCKQGITNYGETPTENFRKQGGKLLGKLRSPMINLLYDGNFLFFSKKGSSERFAVQLNNLTAYKHLKDDRWEYSKLMTDWARESQIVYSTIDSMKAQEQARNNQNNQNNQNTNQNNVTDTMAGTFGGNIATMGLLKAIADHAR